MTGSRLLRWALLFAAVAPLLSAGGCTNSDELNSGVGQFVVEVELTNASTRFSSAGVSFAQITVTPLDPLQAEVPGTPFGLVASTRGGAEIDFNAGETSFAIDAVPPVGTYRVESITLQSLVFQAGTAEAGAGPCIGSIVNYPIIGLVSLPQSGQDIVFDVKPGTSSLQVVIDGDALADAFEQSWGCGYQCSTGCQATLFPPPLCQGASFRCVRAFQSSTFALLAPTYLEFP